MIALGVILTVFLPTVSHLSDLAKVISPEAIYRACVLLFWSMRYRDRLFVGTMSSIIVSYTCHFGYCTRGSSWWMALLCLFGKGRGYKTRFI